MSSVFLTTLQLVALISQPQAVLGEDRSDAIAHPTHDENQEVMMTATGHLQKSVMRRQEDAAEEHHHHSHHAMDVKAMFKALDLDGDGWVSGAEVKQGVKNTDFHVPKVLAEMLGHVNSNDKHSGFNYETFHSAVQSVAHQHGLHHKTHHHATVHEHHNTHPEALMEEPDKSNWVTCGGHKAPSCDVCTKTDSTGNTVFDHGSEWCHGDCVYSEGSCHKAGTVTVVAGSETSNGHATTPTPDIVNPNMTDFDNKVVADAANDAVKEEKLEKAEKETKAEEEANKGFNWGKFWLVVIIIFGAIVGICCIISIVFAVVLAFRTPEAEKGVDEGEALAEGEGEEASGEDDAGES